MAKRFFTIDDIKTSKVAHLNSHVLEAHATVKNNKRHKYGAEPVIIDGHKFMSKKESRRYVELRFKLWSHLISDLRLQVPYELNPGGTHSLKYIADFVYKDEHGHEVVEDAKGYRTREYKKKKQLMLEVHDIEIREV